MIQESVALAWVLQNPGEFWNLSEQFRPDQFRTEPWVRLWPELLKGFREHERWPEGPELDCLLNKVGFEAGTRMVASDLIQTAMTTPVSSYTRADITRWLALQQFSTIGAELLNAGESRHSIQEIIDYQRTQLDKAERLLAGDKMLGEPYRPMDDPENWHTKLEDSYGAKPLPTGLFRLDKKLRFGGVRPTLVLIVGPSGGCKTTCLLCIEAHACRLGQRVVHYSNDDSKGDITERWYSRVLQRPITWEERTEPDLQKKVGRELKARMGKDYLGQWCGYELEPDKDTPRAIIQDLRLLRRQFIAEDLAWIRETGGYVAEDELGAIGLVGIDSGQQIRPEKPNQRHEVELEKLFVGLAHIPRMLNCPLYVTVQGGQQTVGATQITMRDLAGSYGQAKPAKLILGVAQTVAQSQGAFTIDATSEAFKDNLKHMHDYNPQLDRNLDWQPLSLCIIKNTMAESRAGLVKNVIIPMLVDFSTCRMVEDFSKPENLMKTSNRTAIEEKEARPDGPPVTPISKRGKKL